MTWKCWLAAVLQWALLAVALLVGRSCQQEWAAKDAELVAELERYKFLARQSSDRALEANERANTSDRRADELERETARLVEQLEPAPERCRVPIARRDRVIKNQAKEIDVRKATEKYLRESVAARETQILNLETTLSLQEERVDGWKKQAQRSRRDKILIGVGSAIGGAGVMALGVWGAGQL